MDKCSIRLALILSFFLAACVAAPATSAVPTATRSVSTLSEESPTPSPSALTVPVPAPLSSTPASTAASVPPEVTAWLKENAIPFQSTEPGSDMSDLMPLKSIIGDARIVALGEAKHGTREFFRMKHRLVEFLVKEMGFTTFAMEANWPEAVLLNEYIQTGQGDPARLLAGMGFWTWNTQEVLDMIQWMRAYNATRGNTPPIVFTGFDMQSLARPMNDVVHYLRRIDPSLAENTYLLCDCLRPYEYDRQGYATASQSFRSQCRSSLQTVYDTFKQHQAQYTAVTSAGDYAMALQSARVVQQFEDVYSIANGSTAARDKYLAENVSWVLDQAGAGAKIILWAHNYHVGIDSVSGNTMGSYLRKAYGDAMVNIGFTFYAGTFNSYSITSSGQMGSLTTHLVAEPPLNSYERFLHSAGLARYFLNLKRVRTGADAPWWLAQWRILRSIGAAYDDSHPENSFQSTVLDEMFDLLIYLEETSPSQLLGARSQAQVPPTYSNRAENLDFEEGTRGWAIYGDQPDDYVVDAGTSTARSGGSGGYIRNKADNPKGYAALAQTIAADAYRGQRLRLSAFAKSDAVAGGAGVMMHIDSADKILAITNMQSHPIIGTTNWTRYDIVLDVPSESVGIMFGTWLSGSGSVAFDDFQLEAVGEEVPATPKRLFLKC